MPVMSLEVPRRNWNELQLASIRLGLDCEPDTPSDDKSTSVEVSGSWHKLQQALLMCSPEVALMNVAERMERDTQLDAARAHEILENRVRISRVLARGGFHSRATPKFTMDNKAGAGRKWMK